MKDTVNMCMRNGIWDEKLTEQKSFLAIDGKVVVRQLELSECNVGSIVYVVLGRDYRLALPVSSVCVSVRKVREAEG